MLKEVVSRNTLHVLHGIPIRDKGPFGNMVKRIVKLPSLIGLMTK